MFEVGYGDSVNDGHVTMRIDVSSSDDGGALSLTSYSSSFSSRIAGTMIGGEPMVSNGELTTMSAGSYTVGNRSLLTG